LNALKNTRLRIRPPNEIEGKLASLAVEAMLVFAKSHLEKNWQDILRCVAAT
jgi:hypothetical protein